MNSLVAFFDILGTKEMVARGQFQNAHALDFANPVGIVALQYPNMRFAAFSDSVVAYCDNKDAKQFLTVMNMLMGNWFSDWIFVRGGIAAGEINWVDVDLDKVFQRAKNFAYARVYGSALVESSQLQEKSGPGMLCFVSDRASKILDEAVANVIVSGPTNVLAWATEREVSYLLRSFRNIAESQAESQEFQRHVRATQHYFSLMNEQKKFLPNELSINEMALITYEKSQQKSAGK
jgi:hypothetical protein